MTLKRTVFDIARAEAARASGEEYTGHEEDFTPEEEAAHVVAQAQALADQAAADQRRTRLDGARPPNAVLVKLRDNVALSPAELQAVVRFLALREFREAQG